MYEIFSKLLQTYGVTPYKVSKETGVSQSTLSDWKLGKITPKSDTMKKIADYFGVTVDYLMTGNEKPDIDPVLKPRDEKDIKDILANTEQLLKQDGLMFNGDPASPEAIEIHEYCIIFGNSLQSRTFVHVLAVIFVPKFKYNNIGV